MILPLARFRANWLIQKLNFHICLEWQFCLGLFTETKRDWGRIDWLVMCILHHKRWFHFIFLLVHIIWGRNYVPLIKNAIAENKVIIFSCIAWLYILSIEAEKDILWASFCVFILWGGQCHTCNMLKSCEAGLSHLYMSTVYPWLLSICMCSNFVCF